MSDQFGKVAITMEMKMMLTGVRAAVTLHATILYLHLLVQR